MKPAGPTRNDRSRLAQRRGASAWLSMRDRLAMACSEWQRRHELGRQPQPAGVPTPHGRLLVAELASALLPPAFSYAHGQPRVERASHPRAVMLIPGFGSHPWRMAPLRRALTKAGHRVDDWGLGWNLGASEAEFATLCLRVRAMAEAEGQKVTLIGWSLGGVFAREVAKQASEAVAMVITMGSPFSGDMHGNNAWRIYHWIAGHPVDNPPVGGDFAAKPPVPTIALWSARDGIVHRRCACGKVGERDEAHAVRCTHMGFAWHPAAIEAVARILSQDDAMRRTIHDEAGGEELCA